MVHSSSTAIKMMHKDSVTAAQQLAFSVPVPGHHGNDIIQRRTFATRTKVSKYEKELRRECLLQ